eukprot:m.3729 g.3729  ORF g.3729 m.3729 type:complete len:75 (-) comp2118_c0_seq2:201-425(-)
MPMSEEKMYFLSCGEKGALSNIRPKSTREIQFNTDPGERRLNFVSSSFPSTTSTTIITIPLVFFQPHNFQAKSN